MLASDGGGEEGNGIRIRYKPHRLNRGRGGVDSFRVVEEKLERSFRRGRAGEEIRRERKKERPALMKADRGAVILASRITLVRLAPPRVGGRVKWSRRLEDLSNNVRSAKNGLPRHKAAITIRLTIGTFFVG